MPAEEFNADDERLHSMRFLFPPPVFRHRAAICKDCTTAESGLQCTEKKVAWIYLDEAKFYSTKTIKLLSTDKEVKLNSKMYTVTNQYTQLYIPYTNFAQACQLIKSAYSNTPDFKGYFNYMKYWAKHGDPDWICVYPSNNEYDGPLDGKEKVTNTYLATAFWNSNTNGDKSPL